MDLEMGTEYLSQFFPLPITYTEKQLTSTSECSSCLCQSEGVYLRASVHPVLEYQESRVATQTWGHQLCDLEITEEKYPVNDYKVQGYFISTIR